MRLINDDTVQFDIIMPDESWLGLNLGGTGMARGDDMVRFIANGRNSEYIDEISLGEVDPGRDSRQNLSGTFSAVGNEVIFTVTRPLDTGDSQEDFLIPVDRNFNMAWGVYYNSSDKTKEHNRDGDIRSVQIASNGNPTWGPPLPVETESEPVPVVEESTDNTVEDT